MGVAIRVVSLVKWSSRTGTAPKGWAANPCGVFGLDSVQGKAAPPLKAFILTIDVEPDDPDWSGPIHSNKASESLSNLNQLACLIPWMRHLGLRPTLLSTCSAVTSSIFAHWVDRLALHGNFEIGMHLHPAETPPFVYLNRDSFDNILGLDEGLLLAKLDSQLREMARRFDAPKSFRGAAWTLDSRVFRWLSQNGFVVDSSVTPGIDWHMRRRPDWSDAPARPYRINLLNPTIEDDASPIVEVPPSIWSLRRLPKWTKSIPVIRSLMTQPLKSHRTKWVETIRRWRPQEPRWLRPALETETGLREVATALAHSECLHVMIHSNELEMGASPYSRTAAETEALRRRLGFLIETLVDQGRQPMTLTEFAEAWQERQLPHLAAHGKRGVQSALRVQ
jgi:hypothetical protein